MYYILAARDTAFISLQSLAVVIGFDDGQKLIDLSVLCNATLSLATLDAMVYYHL